MTHKLLLGDCLDKLKDLPENSVDSIVTDPPYELGFMGKSWDKTGIANNVEMWKECLRVLKPGGHLLAFSGTRTYHRMASAIEDAGFEVRDMIEWVYGSGFPKSLNIGKAVDKRGGTTADQSKEFAVYIKSKRREQNITLSRADEVVCGGTTNYSWFEGRPAGQRLPRKVDYLKMKELLKLDDRYDSFMEETEREFLGHYKTDMGGLGGERLGEVGGKITKGTSEWEGWGTALKPAHEPICMARKPLAEKTVAENVLKYGTGGINIDESRVDFIDAKDKDGWKYGAAGKENKSIDSWKNTSKVIIQNDVSGRFPANLIHDNSEEVRECFPEQKSGAKKANQENYNHEDKEFVSTLGASINEYQANSGNASRFFKSIIYTSKASKKDRGEGNSHPTVKPVKLMEYLIKMVTPKSGIVLDPFMGSGSTGVACVNLGREFIGIEKEQQYLQIAEARINDKDSATNQELFKAADYL